MRQSLHIEQIAAAIVVAQAEIGGAVKGADNPFFKSKYADLNSVIKELKPIFAKHGMAVLQHPVSDEHGVGVCTRIQHSSGEFIEEFFTLPLAKNDPQAAGSAITYAKRYALKALGLMPDLDDDAEGAMFRVDPNAKDVGQWIVELQSSIDVIKESIASGDFSAGAEAWRELSDEEKHGIWVAPSKGGAFTTSERKTMQSTEFKNGDKI